ncbi:rhodanese-like domain-containing protein [Jeotgalibaca porci]|uniref:rhodanese-like domain-containing protein n=1 Tax=Jeotgalibaca porci TaxID=1868793 RepID=UPI00359FC3B4
MYKSVGMPEFYQEAKKKQLPIVDVRETDEYARGHIPGAVNFPLSDLGSDFTKLDKNTDYYLVCQSGGRSAMAAEFLSDQGFNVTNVMGGTRSWMGPLE